MADFTVDLRITGLPHGELRVVGEVSNSKKEKDQKKEILSIREEICGNGDPSPGNDSEKVSRVQNPISGKSAKDHASDLALSLSEYLLDAIQSHFERYRAPRQMRNTWAKHFDRMLIQDRVSAEDIKKAIDHCHGAGSDPFWRGVCLSGKKIRDNYQTLATQMNNATSARPATKPRPGGPYVPAPANVPRFVPAADSRSPDEKAAVADMASALKLVLGGITQ